MRNLAEIMGRVSVPMVTPFRQDESINFDAIGQLADYVISKNYCDSLILTGTTGEFYALEDDERVQIWRVARDAVAGRVPLVVGVGAPDTRRTVRLAAIAEELGFETAMVVLPYYSKPTQEGLYRHFCTVASSTSLSLMVYNIPLFTGVNMDPETLRRIVDASANICGIKEEAGIAPTQATSYALLMPPEFSIYCGDDTMVLQVLPQRGRGVVSGGSQVIGGLMKEMIRAYFAGDNETASTTYLRLAPFFAALNQNGRINPIPILRAAIEMTSGISIGPPRGPQTPATAAETAVVGKVLTGMDCAITVGV